MCPMTVVSSFVKSHTVGTRSGTQATGFFNIIELEIANQVALIIKAIEVLRRRLLQWY